MKLFNQHSGLQTNFLIVRLVVMSFFLFICTYEVSATSFHESSCGFVVSGAYFTEASSYPTSRYSYVTYDSSAQNVQDWFCTLGPSEERNSGQVGDIKYGYVYIDDDRGGIVQAGVFCGGGSVWDYTPAPVQWSYSKVKGLSGSTITKDEVLQTCSLLNDPSLDPAIQKQNAGGSCSTS